MKFWIFAAQTVAALPLLGYPVLLMANVMSLAGHKTPGENKGWLAAKLFLWSSTAYPLVYLGCGALTKALLARGEDEKALAWGAAPLGYLALVGLLFRNWGRSSKP